MSVETAYVNKAAITRLNSLLADAGYPDATGDTPDAGGYAINIVRRLAGGNPHHQREVMEMIAKVLNIPLDDR